MICAYVRVSVNRTRRPGMLLVTACVVYKAEIVETILKGFNNKKDHMCENKRLHKIPPNLKQ